MNIEEIAFKARGNMYWISYISGKFVLATIDKELYRFDKSDDIHEVTGKVFEAVYNFHGTAGDMANTTAMISLLIG